MDGCFLRHLISIISNAGPQFNPEYLLQPGELIDRFKKKQIIYTNDSVSITDFESVILIENS